MAVNDYFEDKLETFEQALATFEQALLPHPSLLERELDFNMIKEASVINNQIPKVVEGY